MRLAVLLSVMSLFSFSVFAQTTAEEPSDAEISYDDFGIPEQTLKVIEPVVEENKNEAKAFPACDDAALVAQVRQELAADSAEIQEESISERRSRLLALKNTENFTLVEVSTFRPEDNYELANILITAKVNDGLTNEDFQICAGDNQILKRRVFLLLQEAGADFNVSIINYRPGKVTSFIYKK